MTVDTLPDVALLEIFNFYVDEEKKIEAWCALVHVCRKWRNIVFGSPRRLKLRLYCSGRTPARETLNVWPPLPIIIRVYRRVIRSIDNVIAALGHNDRISELDLVNIPSSQLEEVLVAMQRPFPALTWMRLEFQDETVPVDPASFLGGSAPLLQTLILIGIPFSGLPKLILSATHLVHLDLWRIPHSGYISPEAMVTCLSMLTRLENLGIGFESPRSRPDRKGRCLPPQTRALLPVLTELEFKGVGKYLEDLVARIDAPLLNNLGIIFFHQLIFDTPQLTQFIGRTPKFKAHVEARMIFSDQAVLVTLPQTLDRVLKLAILCSQSDWQLSSLAQVCSSSFPQPLVPAVEHLYILKDGVRRLRWQDNIASSQWLELLHPFTGVKGLYISQEFVPRIAPALQELVGERVTEVLPTLRTLFLEDPITFGPVQETIEQFVAARQLANHPITVSRWEKKHFR
jgi:hypothetical protein